MSLLSLITRLKNLDISIELEGDQLKLNAPEGALNPGLLSELKEKKAEIIAFLQKSIQDQKEYLAILPSEKREYYVLAPAQKRLYILQQMEAGSLSYNQPRIMSLEGDINPEKLERTFNGLVSRHESLRTSFELLEGEPVQRVYDTAALEIEYYESASYEGTDQQAPGKKEEIIIDAIIKKFIRPFDLSRAPLFRVGMIKKQDQIRILMMDIHHIISDGTSIKIFMNDFTALYSGKQLPPSKLQYRDCAQWQSGESEKQTILKQEKYWLNRLDGEIPVLDLPTDYSRPAIQRFEGNTLHFQVNHNETRTLKEIASSGGATLFMILLAVSNILLSRLSGQEDLIVGTPTAGRKHEDMQPVIGMFVNTLALRCPPPRENSFTGFLREVKENTLQAFENQEYPFEDLVEKLAVERDMSRNPLFDVMFILQNIFDPSAGSGEIETGGVKIKPYTYENITAKFDLIMGALEREGNLQFSFEYYTKIFKEETIARYAGYFKKIISTVVDNPGINISEIDIIAEAEKCQLLIDFNKTDARIPGDKQVQEFFARQVEKTPDNIAVVETAAVEEESIATSVGRHALTYRVLAEKSTGLARLLKQTGVQPDTIAAVMMVRSPEMITAILGILKAGGAYLPIDPEYPADRVSYILADSGAKLLVTTGNLVKEVKKNLEIIFIDSIDTEFTVFSSSHLHNFSTSHSFHSSHSSNLAYVIYTSGSAGKPKGVLVQHGSVVNVLMALFRDYPLGKEDTYLLKTTYTFDVSVSELFGWFLAGGRLAVLAPGHEKEPQRILDCIERYNITHINFVPSMFGVFLEILDRQKGYKLSGLKYIFLAGEALLPQLVTKFNKLNTGVVLENIYGPTESTIYASQYSLSQWKEDIAPNIPIGKPLQNLRLYILNRYNHVQPIGVSGELFISGKGLARGYLNRPGLTAEKFVPNPLTEKAADGYYERFYCSGDLVRWLPDGNIEFLGRIDTQVKIRGFRIEPGEIESLLLSHNAVKEALVLTGEDDRNDKYLCAYIVADPGTTTWQPDDFLAEHLPGYMIPAYFVLLERMPLNPSGKIDRKALPLPRLEISDTFVPPQDELQETLVEIWSDLLAIRKEKISIDANFFKMGGQSLKAVLLLTRIHKELNVRVPLTRIFKSPRIRDLSNYIKKLARHRFGSIRAAELKEYYGLSSAQKRVYILQQLDEQGIEYNIPSIYILEGDVQKEKLTYTFRQLIRRHESLRTSFELIEDEPIQKIHARVNFDIEYYDLGNLLKEIDDSDEDVSHAGSLMSRSIIEDFIRSFDLSRAPLLRVGLIKVENQNYMLTLDIHHIVTDGTSMELMVTEFFELYIGNTLPLLKVQYKDFVRWQKSNQQQIILRQQEKYWLKQFEGQLPVLNLPADYPRPLVQDFAGRTIHFEIDEADDIAVKRLAQAEGTTLFMILLSFYSILLSKLCNQEYLIIGTPIASRNHIELENIIGMFVNFLALRTFPTSEKTFIQVLQEIKESAARAFENQDYPFEELVKRVEGDRDTSRNPIFDVMLTMQNPISPGKEIPGLKLKPHRYENLISKLDLSLQFTETESKVFYRFEYSTKLFKAETIESMVRYFKTMVSSVLKQPGLQSSEIEILPAQEKKHLLIDLNETGREYPRNGIISGLFEEQAQRTPDKAAVRSTIQLQNIYDQLKPDDVEIEISYEELNERANQLAHLLREMGVGPDSIVGLLVQHPLEKVIGIWGILKSGGAYLPIDPLYPQTVINDILVDSRVQWLISESELSDCLAEIEISGHIHVCFIDEIESQYSFLNPAPISGPGDLAYIIYTSGTTGKPKGTAIKHNGIINYAWWRLKYFRFTESDVTLQPLTYSFDSFCANFYPTFLCGGELVMVPDNHRLDFSYIVGLVREYSVTNVCFAPGLYDALLEAARGEDLQGLRLVVLAGEASSPALLKKSRAKVPHVWLANEYGPTEGTVAATCHPEIQDTTSGIIGNPIANATIYILNDSLRPVLPGAVGEICIGGTGVARGYINNPVLTSQKFVNKSFAGIFKDTGSMFQKSPLLFYKTGDLGRWQVNEGNWTLEFLGRKDHQVKIRGHRIELEQVESVLAKHDKIKEVLVDIKGTGDSKFLCAYVVPAEAAEFYTAEIKNYLQERLPYYMVPSRILRVEKFPLTPNGKIDRKALPDPGFSAREEYTAPRNTVEKSLTRIWAEVLNIKKESIGIDSNFFDLGGHSLRATIVISRIHKALNIRVPLEELFRSPTIRGVYKYIRGMKEERYASIEPVEKREYYALSSAQKRLYILQQMESEHIGYNIPQVIPLAALIENSDRQKLESTFKRVIARHESLRTSFELAAEEPVQKIHAEVPFAIDYFETEEGEADHLIGNFTRPFDLSRAPLLRVGLTNVASSHFMLLLDMHHIITDGSSQALLIDEFKRLYGGEGEELPLLRLQYKDYSQWENSEHRQDLLKEQETYWLTEFLDELPVLHLPTDFPRPLTQGFEGSVVEFLLTGKDAQALKYLAKETGTTLYMCILSIYTILLAKLSNQEDIIVGTPTAARRHSDLEYIIGMFVNTLAMKNYSPGEKTFKEFLMAVKHRTLKAFENQEYPFEELVEKVNVTRDPGRNPIFDVMFSLQNTEEGEGEAEDVTEDYIITASNSNPSPGMEPLQHLNRMRAVKFDLTLTAVNMREKLLFALQYSKKLFKEETVRKFTGYFKTIASIVVGNPDVKIFNIEIISGEEKKQLIEEFNDTEADYPATETIHQLFRKQVEKCPGHIAAVGPVYDDRDITPAGHGTVTYHDLSTKSDRLAALLKRKGIGPGKIVAIMNEPSIEMIVGILGVLKAGSCYLPLDPQNPGQRIQYILKDSETQLLLTRPHPEKPMDTDVETFNFKITGDDGYKYNTEADLPDLVDLPQETGCPGNPVYMIYTSGTTGKPKGVVIKHSNLVNYVNWFGTEIRLTNEDKSVLTSSFAFDLGYTAIFPSLLWGGQLHLLPRETYMSAESLLDYIQAQGISYVKMTPSLFSPLVNSHLFTGETCRSLRWVILGGEAINVSDVEKAHNVCSHLNIMNHYGPTEVTIGCIARVIDFNHLEAYKIIPTIGKPIFNTRVYIVDKYINLLPVGVAGELGVSGASVARGYFKREALTDERFILNPFIGGKPGSRLYERIYRTGDLARWLKDRNIEFLGRIDQQIKIRGFRVELGEIENRLAIHDGIKEAAVIMKTDERGDQYLYAYIAAHRELTGPQLQEFLSAGLPDYMVPSYFVFLETIPLTPNGKLNRKALPKPELEIDAGTVILPGNDIEKKLLQLWSEILSLEKEKISTDNNFFKLGGNSLKATVMISKVHKEFNVKIPLAEVFKTPTIKGLSPYIKDQAQSVFVIIDPVEKKEFYALSSAQKRLYFLQQMDEHYRGYNMPMIERLEGDVDKDRIENTFKRLIRRHESLRTSFQMAEDEPVQKIHDDAAFTIEYYKADVEIDTIIRDFVKAFDLSKTPLLRVGLIKNEEKKYILMADMHHIISDGISMDIFIKEFIALYVEEILPPLRLQYKDYSEWQARLMNTRNTKAQEEYWINRFKGEITDLLLPTDYPRSLETILAGDRFEFKSGKKLNSKINCFILENEITLFMLLQAAFIVLQSKYTEQEDILMGCTITGRRHVDLHNIIGMFVNMLPMRNFPKNNKKVSEFLEEVKENSLNAYENQDYQFDELVSKLNLKRELGRNPLFNVVFALQNFEMPVADVSEVEIPGLKLSIYKNEYHNIPKFDLFLGCVETEDEISFEFHYRSKWFKKTTIERMSRHYINILEEMIKHTEIKISEIQMISREEKHQLIKKIKSGNDSLIDEKGPVTQNGTGNLDASFDF